MKRLAIMSIYCRNQVVDRYVFYYLDSLVKVVNKLVIVVNGSIQYESRKQLERYSANIILRENKGYDIRAFADVIGYTTLNELGVYDEVIYTNDTCLGPFVPFEDIFSQMDARECDFWGLNYIAHGFASHLQSYFLVYRKKVFCELKDYLQKIENSIITKDDACARFEYGFFAYLIRRGYKFDYYTSTGMIDIYQYPDVAIEEYGLPILKKRSFASSYNNSRRWRRIEKSIQCICDYDIDMIKDVIQNEYGFCFENVEESDEEVKMVPSLISEKKIVDFFQNNSEIYLYGAGFWGRVIASIYWDEIDIKGFIVSDGRKAQQQVYGIPVFELSEITNKEASIIVALNKEHSKQVVENLSAYKNVLMLW